MRCRKKELKKREGKKKNWLDSEKKMPKVAKRNWKCQANKNMKFRSIVSVKKKKNETKADKSSETTEHCGEAR